MTSWALVAVVAIVVWGVVQLSKQSRARTSEPNAPPAQKDEETQQEIDALRERIKVLERIATDGNSLDAQETKRIAAEIDALRDKQAD